MGYSMKKNAEIYLVILILLFVLSACNKAEKDDAVNVWMFRYIGAHGNTELKSLIKSEITSYAEENKISVRFLEYDNEEITLDDYKLKRNLAIEHGGADIIIGDMYSGMAQISEYAGDYTKLENYKNIFDSFKGKYCIPIGSIMETILLNNRVLKSYGIECNKYIMLDDYYEIKQSIKGKGAKLKYNRSEELQLFDYYINKNNLEIKKDDKYIIDRKAGLKTIKEISEDILKHYNYDMDENKRMEKLYSENHEEIIYDESSSSALAQRGKLYPLKFLSLTGSYEFPYEDYTVVIRNDIEEAMLLMPCLFINKNTNKDNTYKIADFMISDTLQRKIYNNTIAYSSIVNTSKLKEKTGYNDDWSYKYEPGVTKIYNRNLNKNDINYIIDIVKKNYETLMNTDTKRFFEPWEYREAFREFIIGEVYKLIENPSYDEAEFNKNTDEFLINFNVQYN